MNLGGGNQVAQAPTGHGKSLGEPVEHKGVIREFKDGMFLFSINQAVINLVGYDGRTQLCNFRHSIFAKQITGGVGR